MNKIISASMMCANYSNLEREVKKLQDSGIDSMHIDVMDGKYVPNFGMGLQDFNYICSTSTTKIDVHLMIENPSDYIDLFTRPSVEVIYFHPETDNHPLRLIDKIKANNLKAGIALNPSSSLLNVSELLPYIDYILVMSVNPGFSGQKYVENVDHKIKELINLKDQYNYTIIVDGAVSLEVYKRLSIIGVDGFVLGTSLLFNQDKSYTDIIRELRII